jgi:hypothetical protein
MFKESRACNKYDHRPWRPIFATSEKDISTIKAIVDEDTRFTAEVNMTYNALVRHMCFELCSILKEK